MEVGGIEFESAEGADGRDQAVIDQCLQRGGESSGKLTVRRTEQGGQLVQRRNGRRGEGLRDLEARQRGPRQDQCH